MDRQHARARTLARKDFDKHARSLGSKSLHWYGDGGQGNTGIGSGPNIVEPPNRHILGHPNRPGGEFTQHTECHQVTGSKDGSDIGPAIQQMPHAVRPPDSALRRIPIARTQARRDNSLAW